MPSIRNNEAQQKALNEVSKALGELKSLTYFAQVDNWDAPVTLAFGNGETAHSAIRVALNPSEVKDDAKDVAAIIRILQTRRNRVIKDIMQKTEKWDIELSEAEQALLEGAVIPGKRRRRKKADDKASAEETVSAEIPAEAAAPGDEGAPVQSDAGFEPVADALSNEEDPSMPAGFDDADGFADADNKEEAELNQALGQYNQF